MWEDSVVRAAFDEGDQLPTISDQATEIPVGEYEWYSVTNSGVFRDDVAHPNGAIPGDHIMLPDGRRFPAQPPNGNQYPGLAIIDNGMCAAIGNPCAWAALTLGPDHRPIATAPTNPDSRTSLWAILTATGCGHSWAGELLHVLGG